MHTKIHFAPRREFFAAYTPQKTLCAWGGARTYLFKKGKALLNKLSIFLVADGLAPLAAAVLAGNLDGDM